ncbi:hypothetical protein [Streptomyces sp. NPDC056468]|uniref:hypothetical protein n=1 Tax=Streptomyces sp. NPDC056468 TaxID=3345830 RepID=UPI0036C71346
MADSPAVAAPGRDGDAARAWAQPLRAAGVELSLLLSVPVGEGVWRRWVATQAMTSPWKRVDADAGTRERR